MALEQGVGAGSLSRASLQGQEPWFPCSFLALWPRAGLSLTPGPPTALSPAAPQPHSPAAGGWHRPWPGWEEGLEGGRLPGKHWALERGALLLPPRANPRPGPRLQPGVRGPPSKPLPLVCRCRGRGDGVFQVGDRGPEAVATNPSEHPEGWQGPRDLCGPRPAEWQQAGHLPHPQHPAPPTPRPTATQRGHIEGDSRGVVLVGLKGRTHDWLQEETFLFLNLDQRKPFIFISDFYFFFFFNSLFGIWLPKKLSELRCFIWVIFWEREDVGLAG